jgi:hypothetical protein
MNVLAVISPGLKVLFERVGKPEVINRPEFLLFGRTGAVIACNHVGWAEVSFRTGTWPSLGMMFFSTIPRCRIAPQPAAPRP